MYRSVWMVSSVGMAAVCTIGVEVSGLVHRTMGMTMKKTNVRTIPPSNRKDARMITIGEIVRIR